MIVVNRCRCGATLVPDLHFCVSCGARQEVGVRVPVGAGAPMAGAPMAGGPVRRGPVGQAPAPEGLVPQGPAPFGAAPRPTHPPMPRAAVVPPGVVPSAVVGMAPAPAAPARSTVPWIVAGVSIVVAVVLVAIGVLAARPAVIFGAAAPTPVVTPTVTVGVPVPAVASSDTGSSSATSAGSSGSSGSSESSANSALEAQVATDRSTVDGLVGQWVPQLSAKRDGLVADGITYDDQAILAHFSSLQTRDSSAVMLWSGDWPVFNGSDFWVVVHAQGFSTAAAANAWCSEQGWSADDCFAKKLSHSGGPAGTTVQR
jgi:hypothetical protein